MGERPRPKGERVQVELVLRTKDEKARKIWLVDMSCPQEQNIEEVDKNKVTEIAAGIQNHRKGTEWK